MATLFTPQLDSELYCRPEALQYFLRQLPKLHTREGLLRAAIAISMHALDDVDPGRVEQRLKVMSLRVLERSPSRRPAAILANLHAVLFEEEGFAGNLDNYYNALNNYIPAVLASRCGVPITLSLIYKIVGQWAGLTIQGAACRANTEAMARPHSRQPAAALCRRRTSR